MSLSLGRWQAYGWLLGATLLLNSCNNTNIVDEATLTPSGAVVAAYASATPSAAEGGSEKAALQTAAPTLSPTPIVYVVVANDTLLGIAERQGVALEALLLLNPGVDARFLSIGQELQIPIRQDGESVNPGQATPLALNLGELSCYTSIAGELWCFMLIENALEVDAHYVGAIIALYTNEGGVVAETDAIAFLSKIDSNEKVPVAAYWASAPENWDYAAGRLASAFPLENADARYLDLALGEIDIEISDSGSLAAISGTVQGAAQAESALIWVLAVAYDEEDKVVGVRLWEGDNSKRQFEFKVYSLGANIERVELMVEGRP